jgi:anaerobic magnesium-protoporphyrin IX monomethyl ester cyclase
MSKSRGTCKVLLMSLYSSDAIGIRYISSFLKQAGVDVHLCFFKEKYLEADTMTLPTEREYSLILTKCDEWRPDIIGLSLRSSFFRIATEITRRIQTSLHIPIIWGGTHPNIAPEDCIQVADMICMGWGERPMLDLVGCMAKGEDPSAILNLWIRNKGKIVRNPVRALRENLDEFPFPDYGHEGKSLIEDDKITESDPALKLFNLNIMASRGCPYRCTYCCNSLFIDIHKNKGPLVRQRSVENVLQEIETLRSKFPKLARIDFIDEVFAWKKEWVREFAPKYKARVGLPFQCAQHPNMVNSEVITMLKDAGLERVEVGIQSGCERIRGGVFGRPVSDDALLKTAQIIRRHKIVPFYDLIVANPFEKEEDLLSGLRFILKLPRPFHLRMFPLTYFPNTPLTIKALELGVITANHVENRAERTHGNWFVTLDYPWSTRERYWISLFSLSSKSFIPKFMIIMLAKRKIFRDHPRILSLFATMANNIKLALIAFKWLLEGKPVFSFIRNNSPRKKQSHWHL